MVHTVDAHYNCSRKGKRAAAKTTLATVEENDYDVKGLKFDINLTNTSTAISGNVITYATTFIAGFTVYAFELDTALTIDSFKLNGQLLAVQTTGAVRKATLQSPLGMGVDFTAQVYYHGQPNSGTGQFFTGGLNHVALGTGTHLMYSLSDPDFADDWWPCKQSLKDKIDSVSMWVTVDDTLKVGSNGLLKNTTAMPSNKLRYEWKSSYPIDYYLISVAVAPYKEYSYYMHFTDGSNDSMLIQNFYLDSASFFTPVAKAALDTTGKIVDQFSKLYGKYPFHLEKYGHCMSALTGGMEHQTMTTLGNTIPTLIAHELGHQWWGNNVTYGTWADIWLSEGIATYGEQLFLEYFSSKQDAQIRRSQVFGNVTAAAAGGSVYVDDTTSTGRIFNGTLTYNKGAAVAHMLRYLAPADSLFFKGLQAFQQQYKYSNAVTDDLKNVMEQTYNMQLDTFFRQWIYGQGFPFITLKWYQEGSRVHLKVTQLPSNASVAAFEIPLEIKLESATSDTIVKVDMKQLSEHFIVYWDGTMTGATIDPEDNILNRAGLTGKDPSLAGIDDVTLPNIVVYPNPATEYWNVNNLPYDTEVSLFDIMGKKLWHSTGSANVTVPAQQLQQGTYILEIRAKGMRSKYVKLAK